MPTKGKSWAGRLQGLHDLFLGAVQVFLLLALMVFTIPPEIQRWRWTSDS